MQAFGPRESTATVEDTPRLPLEPIHLVETNLEVEASDQREAADAIFAVEVETEIRTPNLMTMFEL